MKGVIALAPVRALASASSQRYTYIDPAAPREVRLAATLYWEEAPAKMVERAVVQGLSPRIGSVVIDNMVGLGETRRLTVELDRFEEVSGPSARAVVAVRATLVDAKTRGLVFAAPFCRSAPILGVHPSDRSTAFETAIGGVLDDIAADILADADHATPVRAGGATQC